MGKIKIKKSYSLLTFTKQKVLTLCHVMVLETDIQLQAQLKLLTKRRIQIVGQNRGEKQATGQAIGK